MEHYTGICKTKVFPESDKSLVFVLVWRNVRLFSKLRCSTIQYPSVYGNDPCRFVMQLSSNPSKIQVFSTNASEEFVLPYPLNPRVGSNKLSWSNISRKQILPSFFVPDDACKCQPKLDKLRKGYFYTSQES